MSEFVIYDEHDFTWPIWDGDGNATEGCRGCGRSRSQIEREQLQCARPAHSLHGKPKYDGKTMLVNYIKAPVSPAKLLEAIADMHRSWLEKYRETEGEVSIREIPSADDDGKYLAITWNPPDERPKPERGSGYMP